MRISRELLAKKNISENIKIGNSFNLSERVIQFGEGNFLRAFVDWMIDEMNYQGLFNGRVVVVQPISTGLADKLNAQEGLYTLLLRGLVDGQPVEKKQIITSVSRGINAYQDWQECLNCARNPEIEFVISNTTEAGIVFDADDSLELIPPKSFPGKLTAYLYERYKYFHGDPVRGMIIIPCELIEKNGETLKQTVLKLADAWKLGECFKDWIENHNVFVNTLVDRVVTGYPKEEVKKLQEQLGYEDELLDTGELFHLWVIEGPSYLKDRLPFDKAGMNVIWTDDQTPYRNRKVRILNGAHTCSVPAAFLYGLDTVKELMDDEVMGVFIRKAVYDEIIPAAKNEIQGIYREFADSVMERFQNPYIKHYLHSILLNSTSKFKTRVLPSILDYQQKFNRLPEKLTFSLAALLCVYRNGQLEGSIMKARRDRGNFEMHDDLEALQFYENIWSRYDGSEDSAKQLAKKVLSNETLWGQDLSLIEAFTEKLAKDIFDITQNGIQSEIKKMV